MSAHNIHVHTMLTEVGQSVGQVTVCLDGVAIPVVTLSVAAARLGYSKRWTRRLCDEGKLIGIKIDGRWWVLERSVEIRPQTDVLIPA